MGENPFPFVKVKSKALKFLLKKHRIKIKNRKRRLKMTTEKSIRNNFINIKLKRLWKKNTYGSSLPKTNLDIDTGDTEKSDYSNTGDQSRE
jgi:hypothetical protein